MRLAFGLLILAIIIVAPIMILGKKDKKDIFKEVGNVKNMLTSGTVSDYTESGMHYKIFQGPHGEMFVVNITKDSLECIKNR